MTTFAELEDLARGVGVPAALVPIMAAIALAESGGCQYALAGPIDYRPVKSCTYRYTTGEQSLGLWQINIGTSAPQQPALFDPQTNARAMKGKLDGQGLTAWSTYGNGDGPYTQFLPGGSSPPPPAGVGGGTGGTGTVTRPGGGSSDAPGGGGTGIAGAIPILGDVLGFLNAVVWLFDPRNWLRVVEGIVGVWLLVLGLVGLVVVFSRRDTPAGRSAKRTVRRVAPRGVGDALYGAARSSQGARSRPDTARGT